MANEAITVDEAYKESDDFVPNPSDMRGTYNTSGLGASERIEEVSSVFEVDKVNVAQEIVDALDPDSPVSSSKVLLPNPVESNEEALDQIETAAERRLEQGAVIGGPGPAERDAALETGDADLRAEGTADEKTSLAAKGTSETAAQSAAKDESTKSADAKSTSTAKSDGGSTSTKK